jgi:hypothetical protein
MFARPIESTDSLLVERVVAKISPVDYQVKLSIPIFRAYNVPNAIFIVICPVNYFPLRQKKRPDTSYKKGRKSLQEPE